MASSHQNQFDQASGSYQQILQKLGDTQDELHKAQEKISSFQAAENEYQLIIASQRQQLADWKAVSTSTQMSSHTPEEHTHILSDMRNQLEALRKDCDNRQMQWTSEKLLLEADLNQLRNELLQCERKYSHDIHHQAELTHKYVLHSEEVITLLQENIANANKVRDRMQNDIIKLSLEKERLQSRLSEIQRRTLKARETASEMALTHAAAIRKQDRLIASLRNELDRLSLRHCHRRNSTQPFTIEGEPNGSEANVEEAALIREFNATLFERLAASEDQIGTLKQKVQILEDQLWRSRQEVYNYVDRVKTGALIIESDACKTDWNASNRNRLRPEDRTCLFQKMELLLQETVLENIQLSKEKNELGQQLINQHNSVQERAP